MASLVAECSFTSLFALGMRIKQDGQSALQIAQNGSQEAVD